MSMAPPFGGLMKPPPPKLTNRKKLVTGTFKSKCERQHIYIYIYTQRELLY